jgi:hypothetical protein
MTYPANIPLSNIPSRNLKAKRPPKFLTAALKREQLPNPIMQMGRTLAAWADSYSVSVLPAVSGATKTY